MHDLGHIVALRHNDLKMEPLIPSMDGCGAEKHEHLGGDYLKAMKMSRRVEDICRNHVQAKRYLCWQQPGYYE